MTIEYTPVDIACNLKCDYCYQLPMRDAGNISNPSHWERAKAELTRQNHAFAVFGGEPLLASIEHLEEVFKFGYEKFGSNGIQTNGTLLTDEHIRLFRTYKVGVGVSCDGPGDLSDLRKTGTVDETRLATNRTLDAIKRLCEEGITPSIIVTVHRMNGSIARREEMLHWFSWLEDLGVRHINLHMLEVEKGMEEFALDEFATIGAFTSFYNYARTSKMEFQPFVDIHRLLTGHDAHKTNCIWNACDPLTTPAVQGVSRDGSRRNCGRTNKEGVNWVKADSHGRERYILLQQTPQEFGGCKDCRFFAFCKGNCPGTAINGDWRNRTVHCPIWFHLFDLVERELILSKRLPISREPERLKRLEFQLTQCEQSHLDTPHLDHHGDSTRRGVSVKWLQNV